MDTVVAEEFPRYDQANLALNKKFISFRCA
jgi:hypothetical protein